MQYKENQTNKKNRFSIPSTTDDHDITLFVLPSMIKWEKPQWWWLAHTQSPCIGVSVRIWSKTREELSSVCFCQKCIQPSSHMESSTNSVRHHTKEKRKSRTCFKPFNSSVRAVWLMLSPACIHHFLQTCFDIHPSPHSLLLSLSRSHIHKHTHHCFNAMHLLQLWWEHTQPITSQSGKDLQYFVNCIISKIYLQADSVSTY